MRKILFLFFSLVLLFSCGNKKEMPKDILPKEKMQTVLWDMICASQYLTGFVLNRDSIDNVAASAKAYGQVFQVHHITKEEFDKSYAYYREHPELMKVILDSLGKKQNYATEKLQQKGDTLSKKMMKRGISEK